MLELNKIYCGDCLEIMKEIDNESINCCITSPPYWALRDYGHKNQLGLEPTFQEYINKLCNIFDEIKRVLKKDGTCWVVIGDSYSGNRYGNTNYNEGFNQRWESSPNKIQKQSEMGKSNVRRKMQMQDKSLVMIPFRFAIEMVNHGWILRNTIIWYKPSCMPFSGKDRFTVDFEYVFFFVKNKKYWFEQQFEKTLTKDNLIRNRDITKLNKTPGRSRMAGLRTNDYEYKNKRAVWQVPTQPFPEAHFAVYPEELIEPMIKAGCPENNIVLDPFMGSGTTGVKAKKLGRNFIGIEINPAYVDIANKRLANTYRPMELIK